MGIDPWEHDRINEMHDAARSFFPKMTLLHKVLWKLFGLHSIFYAAFLEGWDKGFNDGFPNI